MQPMRMGMSCIAGIIFSAAQISGTVYKRAVMTKAGSWSLDLRISLTNCEMKQMCAMAKPPICPSKLPSTPIASPMAQKQKPTTIRQGISPMPPNASSAAGKASRIANDRLSPSGLPTGTKNHTAANRKAATVTRIRNLPFFIVLIISSRLQR